MASSRLLEEIEEMPVVDTHEHFDRYSYTFGYNMPRFFYYSCYVNMYSGYMPGEWIGMLEDPEEDEFSQFRALLAIREQLKFSQCRYLMDEVAKRAGLLLKEENFGAFREWYANRNADEIAAQNPEIQAYICNSIGHPMFGGLEGLKKYMGPGMEPDPKIHRVLNITDFHSVADKEQLQMIGRLADMEIGSLKDWERAVEYVIRTFVKLGIVGFKELYLYFRPLHLGAPDQTKAVREMNSLLKGETSGTGLMDYMMFKVYEILSQYRLPVAVHTGCTLVTGESALYFPEFIKIIESVPEVNFDLLHLNYPVLESYMAILKSCPNAYGNCTWITSSDREYTKQYMAKVLDAVPVDHTSFFGGDRHCAGEPVGAVLQQTRQLLAEGLEEMIRKHYLNEANALEIARLWLYENPRQLYGLR